MNMLKWSLIALVLLPALFLTAAEEINVPGADVKPRVLLLDAKHLSATRHRIREGEKSFAPALAELEREAKEALTVKPFSVVNKSATPPSGDKHDYMSQAPYFWPNLETSNGLPYIRRDGERNPEINRITDRRNLGLMHETVETLALAYYFTGNEPYADKAAELLRAWFLDPATRMNPHLEFGQAIPGVNTGRGIGLIETRGLVRVVDSIGLLADAKAWTMADQNGMEKWFAFFLNWMQTSRKGRDEAAAKNNHGTYYDVQVVSFALFLNRRDLAMAVLNEAREKRIAVQIEPDGSQPLELARTRAWSYSTGNLFGLMSLANLGERVGMDLWNFETTDGRGIRRAFDYLMPFGTREKPWLHPQLGGWSADSFLPLLREAAAHYTDPALQDLDRRMNRRNSADRWVLLHPTF
jgi:hypothetical protein